MTSTAIVAYLALFATVGFLFVLVSLLLGRLLRAAAPTPQKLDIYECGEPAVGPGSVQFDLRFYFVALVFLIFEVEVALFFPTATVFGKATRLRNPALEKVQVGGDSRISYCLMALAARQVYWEMGIPNPELSIREEVSFGGGGDTRLLCIAENTRAIESQGRTLALASMLDLSVFFAVLLVGFAYVWRRGDLDWVHAVRHPTTPADETPLSTWERGRG